MIAMETYLQWISKDIPVYANVPWLGVGKFQNYQEGNNDNGAQVYETKCVPCHGPQGQGNPGFPPLWGDRAYNDGAGMAKPETLATFALYNMPLGNPDLTVQQAQDVGAFVDSQPRPHFQKPAGSNP